MTLRSIGYICEAEGRSVYQYSDGTYRFNLHDDPLAKCKFCNKFTSYVGTGQCNGCWEVSGRLEQFLRSPAARKFTLELLAEVCQ